MSYGERGPSREGVCVYVRRATDTPRGRGGGGTCACTLSFMRGACELCVAVSSCEQCLFRVCP